MSGNPWYKRYPKDFFDGTVNLTFEEKGAYTLCLDMMYRNGGPIPDDPHIIRNQLGCSMQLWKKLRKSLIEHGKLQVTDDGRLANSRATYEMHLSRVTSAAQGARAKHGGGRPRKHPPQADASTPNVVSDMPMQQADSEVHVPRHEPEVAKNLQETSNLVPTKLPLFTPELCDFNVLGFTDQKPLRDSERKSPPPPRKSPYPREAEEAAVLEAWKKTGLPEPRKMSPERRRRLADRIRDHGLDGVLEAVVAIGNSRFCHGEGAKGGWKATFDFLVQERSCLGALEGKYADRGKSAGNNDPHAGWFGP